GDYSTALRVLQDEGKLEGIYPKSEQAATGGVHVAAGVVNIFIPHNDREALPGAANVIDAGRPLPTPATEEPLKAKAHVILPEQSDDEGNDRRHSAATPTAAAVPCFARGHRHLRRRGRRRQDVGLALGSRAPSGQPGFQRCSLPPDLPGGDQPWRPVGRSREDLPLARREPEPHQSFVAVPLRRP